MGYRASNYQSCLGFCKQNSKCVAFTFRRSTCYLKRSIKNGRKVTKTGLIFSRKCDELPDCKIRWALWKEWGACSVDCGVGTQTRERKCLRGSRLINRRKCPAEDQPDGKK